MRTRGRRRGFACLDDAAGPRPRRAAGVGTRMTLRRGQAPPDLVRIDKGGPMTQDQRTHWIAELRATPERLTELARRCAPEAIDRKPSPEAFSPREVVHHLRDIEVEGHGARLERILAESEPLLPDVNGDLLAIERRYNARPHEPALEEFRRARTEAVTRLEGLRPDEWSRTGHLGGVGTITVERLVEIWRVHDREHLEEMRRLVEV